MFIFYHRVSWVLLAAECYYVLCSTMFPHVPKCHVPACSLIFPHVPPSCSVLPQVPPSSLMFFHVPSCSPILPDVFPKSPHVSPHFPMSPNVPPCSSILPHIPTFPQCPFKFLLVPPLFPHACLMFHHIFLNLLYRYVWPWAIHDSMCHDSYSCSKFPSTRPFPTKRKLELNNFVAAIPAYDDLLTTICPIECRPPEHQDWTIC